MNRRGGVCFFSFFFFRLSVDGSDENYESLSSSFFCVLVFFYFFLCGVLYLHTYIFYPLSKCILSNTRCFFFAQLVFFLSWAFE